MKIRIESTTKIVELCIGGQVVPARVWEGRTESGIPVHCYITRVDVPHVEDQREFERELQEIATPSPAVAALPARFVFPG